MPEKCGKWPGVVAIVGDADMYCVPCAKRLYGDGPLQAVIEGVPDYERYTDHGGNPLTPVLSGSEDLHGQHCGGECLARVMRGELTEVETRLCDEDCSCYGVDGDVGDDDSDWEYEADDESYGTAKWT